MHFHLVFLCHLFRFFYIAHAEYSAVTLVVAAFKAEQSVNGQVFVCFSSEVINFCKVYLAIWLVLDGDRVYTASSCYVSALPVVDMGHITDDCSVTFLAAM